MEKKYLYIEYQAEGFLGLIKRRYVLDELYSVKFKKEPIHELIVYDNFYGYNDTTEGTIKLYNTLEITKDIYEFLLIDANIVDDNSEISWQLCHKYERVHYA